MMKQKDFTYISHSIISIFFVLNAIVLTNKLWD